MILHTLVTFVLDGLREQSKVLGEKRCRPVGDVCLSDCICNRVNRVDCSSLFCDSFWDSLLSSVENALETFSRTWGDLGEWRLPLSRMPLAIAARNNKAVLMYRPFGLARKITLTVCAAQNISFPEH